MSNSNYILTGFLQLRAFTICLMVYSPVLILMSPSSMIVSGWLSVWVIHAQVCGGCTFVTFCLQSTSSEFSAISRLQNFSIGSRVNCVTRQPIEKLTICWRRSLFSDLHISDPQRVVGHTWKSKSAKKCLATHLPNQVGIRVPSPENATDLWRTRRHKQDPSFQHCSSPRPFSTPSSSITFSIRMLINSTILYIYICIYMHMHYTKLKQITAIKDNIR